LVASLEIQEAQLVKLSAERLQVGLPVGTHFEQHAGYARPDATTIHYRYDLVAHVVSETGIELGRVEAAVVLAVATLADADPPSVEMFGATSGAVIVHPFLREVLASPAQRIGYPGIMLPLLAAHPGQSASGAAPPADDIANSDS
jgi:hypothetical protein